MDEIGRPRLVPDITLGAGEVISDVIRTSRYAQGSVFNLEIALLHSSKTVFEELSFRCLSVYLFGCPRE